MNTANQQVTDEASLILAAEECRPDSFDTIHKFSVHDRRIIRKLVAHGPVLLQGGRGSGKSAFMIAASREMDPHQRDADVVGLYISLRYVPLLQSSGAKYENLFCKWVSARIQKALSSTGRTFADAENVEQLKQSLAELALTANKRVVLLFDDAAHIGRETSLGGFFDIFRTLASDAISCKAAIYPGVTEFGTRFDVYNDATVVDVVRSPEQVGFGELFRDIMASRYPVLSSERMTGFDLSKLAAFLGTALLGNVRGFVFACNDLLDHNGADSTIGYTALGESLLRLAADYYWPLLDEVKPKLGRYVPAVDTAQEIANVLLEHCASSKSQSALVHKQVVARFTKPFEILEYAGFIARREASRALKSGGRGPRYAINLCNLLESVHGSRLTAELFDQWLKRSSHPTEFHERGDHFNKLTPPVPQASGDIAILAKPIDVLRKSKAYPYGLTDLKLQRLGEAGIGTVGDLASASDDELLAIPRVGAASLDRFKSVVGQAIWM